MAKHSINENYNGQTKLRHWWIVIRDNLSNLLGWYNSHIDGTADRHRAEDIDYDDSGTVKEKINKIDMSLFKQTNKLPDEILTPGFYYGGGVVNGTLGGSGTYWFAIEIYPVFTNLLQILHQNVNGEWTTYYRNVSGLESDTPQFTEWVRLAKISDVTALRTEVINQIGNTQNLTTVEKENLVNAINEVNQNISNEVNARVNADETIRKEIPIKTTETITSETTDNSSYVTPLVVKNAISNLVESSDEIKNIADGLAQKADKVTNGGFIAGGAKVGEVENISIGDGIASTGAYGVVIGSGAEGAGRCVAVGSASTAAAANAVAIGYGAECLADNAVQIGDGSNSDKETLKFRDYKIVECESNSNAHYLKDIGRIINLETKDKNSIVGAVNEIYKNLEFSLIVPNAISQSVIMTKDSDGKYKFSFTFNNAYITSNRLFDNDFKSQINNTFEINMLDAPEFNKPYYLYLEWDLILDEFTMFSTADNFGTNLNTECLQFYIGTFTIVDDKTVDYYDEQEKISVNLIPMIGNYLSRLDYKCYELQRDTAKKNTAVLLQKLDKTEEFNIWQNGNWIVGYNIPPIKITDETYGSFTLPSQMLEAAGVKEEAGEEKKYCYASYVLDTDNLSGEISGSDMTVTCGLKEAKGKPNSYIEIEDETKLATINIYLGTIILNAEDYMTPDGTSSTIYSGSETTNTEMTIDLFRIFTESTDVSGELVEITADEVSALF